MSGNSIMDLFMQMYEGNTIAWFAFSLMIVAVGLVVVLFIIWWKMPQPAKKLLLNNLIGHRPTIADCYDNKVVRFENPHIFREGMMRDKVSGWHFHPRLTKDADKELSKVEQEMINKVFTMEGASGQFYQAYSGKGTIVNPELMAIMENPELFGSTSKKKGNPNGYVYVNKQAWINALKQIKDDFVQIKPVWVTTFLDPRKIKNYLSKAYSKSQLLAQEIEIMESAREQYQGNVIKLLLILNIVSVVGIFILAAKSFGMF